MAPPPSAVRVDPQLISHQLPRNARCQPLAARGLLPRRRHAGRRLRRPRNSCLALLLQDNLARPDGGRLEVAQQLAAHSSPVTTGIYDRRLDELTRAEVEQIAI